MLSFGIHAIEDNLVSAKIALSRHSSFDSGLKLSSLDVTPNGLRDFISQCLYFPSSFFFIKPCKTICLLQLVSKLFINLLQLGCPAMSMNDCGVVTPTKKPTNDRGAVARHVIGEIHEGMAWLYNPFGTCL